MRILSIFGTRPDAIKMAPVVRAIAESDRLESSVCVSGQHRDMLRPVMDLFGIKPDFDLDIMKAGQDLTHITTETLLGLKEVIAAAKPDWVLVHGDTTTALAAALAAFYGRVKIGHVEAGLRTHDFSQPYPEEMNRAVVDRIADLHFAPTASARDNLLRENVDAARIKVTGNTVIDALLHVRDRLHREPAFAANVASQMPAIPEGKRIIVVTGHRRENFGSGLEAICRALARIAQRHDVDIIYPVHLNPNVREPVQRLLGGKDNIHLWEPVDYAPFVHLMERSHIVLSDSGGIQEEAPSLGKPVLVMRNKTERPEAVAAGTVKLVGSSEATICAEVDRLLDSPEHYAAFARAHNPYGDGQASKRIVAYLIEQDEHRP
jgi:UDP-N-acetylglucosamine 2-epimerase (non-hydrolysing)